MTLGSSHFRDEETKLWTFSHLPKVTDSGRLEQQVSWAQAGCTHHFRPFTLASPLLTSLSGPLGQAPWGLCSRRDPWGLTQSHAHGGAHTQPSSCETNSNSLHRAPPHSQQVGHGYPGQLAAMRAPGALHQARQSQDPNPAALPGQACCQKATLAPEPGAHTDTNTLPPQPYWLLPLIPRPATAP